MSEQVLLEMKNIQKSFGSAKVLTDVNFTVYKGEVHALMGRKRRGEIHAD